MEQTFAYQNGEYTGEARSGLPHGKGRLEISDTQQLDHTIKKLKHVDGILSVVRRRQ